MTFQVAFLVGGFGTRLGALTKTTPKPLLPVRGRPFLDYLIDRASYQGAGEVLLIAGYLGEQIQARYQGQSRNQTRISVVVEREPCGTAGALRFAAAALHADFVLANGDTYFDVPLDGLMRPCARLVRMAVRHVDDAARYGAINLEPDRTITGFSERGAGGPGLVNGGIYRMDRRVIARIPPSGTCSLERDVFPGLAAEGLIEGEVFAGVFIDIGVPEDLARAQALIPADAASPAKGRGS